MRSLVRLPRWSLVLACLAVAVATSVMPWSPPPASAQGPYVVQQLTKLADDTFLFSMTEYNALLITTDEGVILVDPVGPTRAPLLKAAIAAVTDQPVRYVIYAHDHLDHAGGGAIFADTAQF